MRHIRKTPRQSSYGTSRPRGRRPTFHSRASATAPSIDSMNAMLVRSGIRLDRGQLQKLWRYHNLIRARNQDRELTRIIGFESVVLKHYVDSFLISDLIKLPSPLLDLGTGAGFPGIPLKIRNPGLELVLAEPRPKRIAFLKEAIRTLQLDRVQIFEHKVVSRSFDRPVKAVITRAVEEIEKTVLRTSGCLRQGGLLIFMKGPNADQELKVALDRFSKAIRLLLDRSYQLPHTPHERRLIVLERTPLVAPNFQR